MNARDLILRLRKRKRVASWKEIVLSLISCSCLNMYIGAVDGSEDTDGVTTGWPFSTSDLITVGGEGTYWTASISSAGVSSTRGLPESRLRRF
jgi:hypothetical protein